MKSQNISEQNCYESVHFTLLAFTKLVFKKDKFIGTLYLIY